MKAKAKAKPKMKAPGKAISAKAATAKVIKPVDPRVAARKQVDSIQISDLTLLGNYSLIAKEGIIADASTTGFLVVVNRKELTADSLRANLNLDALLGQKVVLYLPQMNLDLDGTITRTAHRGQGNFEVAIQFSPDIPAYWRECLIDLLPGPGELDREPKP